MKKVILMASMVLVALNVSACGDSQADKEQKEREHAASITKAVPMPEIKSDAEIAAQKQKIPAPTPEIKLGEPPVK